uniref:Uncharacterized protein n=1 Tax=Romanomermis culicivorax TaxID=13658 RepID=A0A915IAY8_ROMCU
MSYIDVVYPIRQQRDAALCDGSIDKSSTPPARAWRRFAIALQVHANFFFKIAYAVDEC